MHAQTILCRWATHTLPVVFAQASLGRRPFSITTLSHRRLSPALPRFHAEPFFTHANAMPMSATISQRRKWYQRSHRTILPSLNASMPGPSSRKLPHPKHRPLRPIAARLLSARSRRPRVQHRSQRCYYCHWICAVDPMAVMTIIITLTSYLK